MRSKILARRDDLKLPKFDPSRHVMVSTQNQLNEIREKLNDIDARLRKVEESARSNKRTKIKEPIHKKSKGLRGAIQLLVDNGFLSKQLTLVEVKSELDREAYFYPLSSVANALTRDFTRKMQILTRLKNENGDWVYVIRR